MIPLSVPNLTNKEWQYIKRCLDTNWVSSAGKFVDDFENAVRDHLKSKYAIACINGTSGLFIALKLADVGAGDEVVVPDLTFIAPVNAARYLGAEPIFMDCDEFMNLDVEKLGDFCRKECRLTRKGLKNKKSGRIIRAIVAVHVFGNPCNLEQIMKIAKKYMLKVVEDNAEAIGAYYTKGLYQNKFTGTIGDFGILSFNGNKIVTTGNGGMILTNDRLLAQKARYFSDQAKDDSVRYIHHEVGYNFRLSNLQAALGLAQIKKLSNFIEIKKRNYRLYQQGFENLAGVHLLGIPEGVHPNYWFYSLIIDEEKFGMGKEELMYRLMHNNIQTRPVWYPNHLQRPYKDSQAYRIEKSLYFWKNTLNIPCSTGLKKAEIRKVITAIKKLRN